MLESFVEVAGNPCPPGIQHMALDSGGVRLRAAFWPGAAARPRGTILLLQGRAEFIEKYFEVAGEMLQRGFAVAALDWRGQGGSDRLLRNPAKGHVDDFDDYLRDLQALVAELVRRGAPQPFHVLAHSTGGAVALLAAARGTSAFGRMVLTAPLIRLAALRHPRAAALLADSFDLLGLGSRFLPGGGARPPGAEPFETNILTSDEGRYRRTAALIEAEPRLAVGDPSIGWVAAAFRAMRRMEQPEFGARNRTPILMVLAGADRLVSSPAAMALAQRLRAAGSLTIAGARHEILMERDALRAQFLAALDAFLPAGEEPPADNPEPVSGQAA